MALNNLGARTAWYVFGANLKQNEVAKKLNLSRSKTTRLITSLRNNKSIHYTIDGNPEELLQLEDELCQKFSLQSCFVCPSPVKEDPYFATGGIAVIEAGVHKLQSMIKSAKHTSMGLGKNKIIRLLFEKLTVPYNNEYSWIALHGSLGMDIETNPYEIIQNLCNIHGGQGYLLPIPSLAMNKEIASAVMGRQGVTHVLELAKKASSYTFSIASITDTKYLKNTLGLNEENIKLLSDNGAVGDIFGHFIDAYGNPINGDNLPVTMALPLCELKSKNKIKLVIAGGEGKSKAIRAALRGGYISDLVIDATIAKTVLSDF